jgi:alpha-galactosidase
MQTSGMLEVWAGPLTNGRIAVAMFNRSPSTDSITATWAAIGAKPGASYDVLDIWASKDMGTFAGGYSAQVASHGTAFLILTPH